MTILQKMQAAEAMIVVVLGGIGDFAGFAEVEIAGCGESLTFRNAG